LPINTVNTDGHKRCAFDDGKLIQAFVGRQSFADEPVGPTAPSGRAASALQSQTVIPGALG